MIRRHVLAALAAGVEAGDDEAARDAARRTDWIIRGAALRQLHHALIDAALLTGEHVSAADPDVMRHVQRVAALGVAGRIDVDVTDRAAVAATYAELPAAAPPRAPVMTIFAGSIVAAAVLMFVWLGVSLRTPHRGPRRTPPLVTGAYWHGGAPARDGEIERVLVDELAQLVLDTYNDREGSREGAPRARRASELRESRVIAERGPALMHEWRELIDALDQFADAPAKGKAAKAAADALGRHALDVSEQFAALGLGYYLQADRLAGGQAHALIFAYRVEEVAFVRAGGERRRVLSLRRLDRLNLTHSLLGRHNDELGDPVILLDQIDRFAHKIMFATTSGYPLGDESFQATRAGRMLSARAGEAVARELALELRAPETERSGRMPASEDDDHARRLAKVTALAAATVRRHEARHGIDADRARPLRYPKPLAALLGKRDVHTGRAELELAAYLSQIGNDPTTPQLSLWNVATQAFHAHLGSAESYAAVVILEGLARQLGVDSKGPLVTNGRLDRSRLAYLAEPLAFQSSEKLRTAARQLWIELYGEPMLPIVDVPR